jgi:hypothetical protein
LVKKQDEQESKKKLAGENFLFSLKYTLEIIAILVIISRGGLAIVAMRQLRGFLKSFLEKWRL